MRRTQLVLYAVTLREWPDVVKLGRTTKCSSRRREYDTWNFADGDGVQQCVVYVITEEYADLSALECACLDGMAMMRPRYRGNEWFKGSIEDAKNVIADVLNTAGVSYIETSPGRPAPKVRLA